MVARLKDKGLQELRSLRSRTLRLAGLERIGRLDAQFIVDKLDEVEARIVRMHERPQVERRQLW